MNEIVEGAVLGRARQNFRARNRREDRAWSLDGGKVNPGCLVLSAGERSEFIEQARHELELEMRRGVSFAFLGRARGFQIELQGSGH